MKKFKKDFIPDFLKEADDGSLITEGKDYREYLKDSYGMWRARLMMREVRGKPNEKFYE